MRATAASMFARLLAVVLTLVGCAGQIRTQAAAPARVAIARPSGCRDVRPGASLQEAVSNSASGSALCLDAGVYPGPLRIDKAITLWSPPEAIIQSKGIGTTVEVTGEGTRILGLTIDGSGGRFDTLDAALHVVSAKNVEVEGVTVRHATFGILIEKSEHVVVRHCDVVGSGEKALGMRGDGIRLWETRDSEILDNVVTQSRDLVVWYSSGNRLARNVVTDGRYGTHLMYSHHNVLEDNRYLRDVVGVFLMYSHDVALRRNLVADASGAAGMGIGVKESGNLDVDSNRFVRDSVAMYLDTTPLEETDSNRFTNNVLRLGDTGVLFHGPAARNRFEGNVFRDERANVKVDGDSDALEVEFVGNDFDDYAGYDLDGDGYGDIPYELRSLSGDLEREHPQLSFLEGTPALALVDAVGKALPLFEPKLLMRDPKPRLGALDVGRDDAR